MRRLSRPVIVALFALVALLAAAPEAMATHFRYGTITWSTPNPAQPHIIVVRFDSAWRRTYFNPVPVVGSIVSLDGASAGVLEVLNATTLSNVMTPIDVNGTVTAVNSLDDWISTTWTATITLPTTLNADYILQFRGCCRISTLQGNNNDIDYIVRSRVTVRSPVNRPPTSASLPIISVPINQLVNFTVPAFDPDGDPLTFSIPPSPESGLLDIVPPGSPSLSVNSAGVVTWRPTVLGLYAVQFKVTDGPIPAKGASAVIDVIFSVVTSTGTALPPTLTINGNPPPATFSVLRGTLLSFLVNATSLNVTPLTLASSALPLGANMTPSLPTSGMGNVTSTFRWTPTPSQVGSYIISYQAILGTGQQAIGNVNINVTNDPPTVTCNASGGTIEAEGPGGAVFTVTSDLDDADPADRLVYQVFVDGLLRLSQANIDPPATRTFMQGFPLGNHTYEVRVTDSVSPAVSCTGTFSIVDTTAPSLILPPNVTIDGSGPAGAPYSYSVSAVDIVDTTPTVLCDTPSGSFFSYGVNTVACTATDDAGNVTAGLFTVTVNDPTGPIVSFAINGTLGGGGWYKSDVDVTWTVTDPDSGVESMSGCDLQLVNADTAGVDFTCTATNNTGVSSTVTTSSIKRDATAPTITTPDVSATATGPQTPVDYPAASANDSGSGLFSLGCLPEANSMFGVGTWPVTCTARDVAGNESTSQFTVTVTDTTAPVLTLPGNLTVPGTPNRFLNWIATAEDAVTGSEIVTCTPASPFTFPPGTTTVNCSATDDYSNTGSGSFTVTVTDTSAPVITSTVTGTLGNNSWYIDSVDISWTVTDPESSFTTTGCGPTSMTSQGTQSFTCAAESEGGASSSTVALKRDSVAPSISTPGLVTALATSPAGANVAYTVDLADATSGLASSSCTPASGSLFPIGDTTVNCTATDNAGHSTDASFIVRVNDTIPPVISNTTPSLGSLWPANHQMMSIAITVSATDNLGPAPTCTITGVASNEPQNGLGDGDTPNDWVITGPLTLQLRAERSGRGDGRVYTVTVQCVDASGNTAASTTTVNVPKSQSK